MAALERDIEDVIIRLKIWKVLQKINKDGDKLRNITKEPMFAEPPLESDLRALCDAITSGAEYIQRGTIFLTTDVNDSEEASLE